MELEALKTRLATVQSLYVDGDKSTDDIVYGTFDFVREAHTVAKLLLLEGRYAELQRCLHLCQSAFYPPHSKARLTTATTMSSTFSSPTPSASARFKRESTSAVSLMRSSMATANPVRTPDAAAAAAAMSSPRSLAPAPAAAAAAAPSRHSSTASGLPRDFPTIQLQFWSFLSDEDTCLFRALYERTQKLQKQLDEARQTRRGRDTAYYVHKLVENRPDAFSDFRSPGVSHTFSSLQRPISFSATVPPSHPSLTPPRRTLEMRTMPAISSSSSATTAPAPPERGIALGNRTKLNRWKIGHALAPFVTSSRMFLGDGEDMDDDSDPLFSAHSAVHRDSDPGLGLSTSTGSAGLPPSRLANVDGTGTSLYMQRVPSDLTLLLSSDSMHLSAAESRVQMGPRALSSPSSHKPHTTTPLVPLSSTNNIALPRAPAQSVAPNTVTPPRACSLPPLPGNTPLERGGEPTTSLATLAKTHGEDTDGLVAALCASVGETLARAAAVSGSVDNALRPRRRLPLDARTPTLDASAVVSSSAATTFSVVTPSPPARATVKVGEVPAHQLSAAQSNPAKTLLSCMSQTAELVNDADATEAPVPEEGVNGSDTSDHNEDALCATTAAQSTSTACESEECEQLFLVTADCSADRKLRALHACRYQAYPQVCDLIHAHLVREKAEENLMLDRLLNAERKDALQPPCLSSTFGDSTGEVGRAGPIVGAAVPKRLSADVGSTTVLFLRTQGHSHMRASQTATHSQTVFQELRFADREIRRRSRVLGLSATSEDAPHRMSGKRFSASGDYSRADYQDGAGTASAMTGADGHGARGTLFLPNVFFVEEADDEAENGGDGDDWEASINPSRAGRTQSTLSELKSTLLTSQPPQSQQHASFRLRRSMTGSFTHGGPSRKASMYSFRNAGPSPVLGGSATGRGGRARKDSVVVFTSPHSKPRLDAGLHRSNSRGVISHDEDRSMAPVIASLGYLQSLPDWTTVPLLTLQSNLTLCVCAVRIQTFWRALAARRLMHRRRRRVHRYREEEIRRGRAVLQLQRFWRERRSRQVMRHRHALRDYAEERRVMEERLLYPSAQLELDAEEGMGLTEAGDGEGLKRAGSFYVNRLMRYASYASLNSVSDHCDDDGPTMTGEDSRGVCGTSDGAGPTVASVEVPARVGSAASRPRGSSFSRRTARNSFHMVPSVHRSPGSRRASLMPSRQLHGRRPSFPFPTSPTENGTGTTATQLGRIRTTALPIFGVPPTLSAARGIALRHLQRHIAARAVTRFLREAIAKDARRMQREVFGLTHLLTGQWTRQETRDFIQEEPPEAEDEEEDNKQHNAVDHVGGQSASVGKRDVSFLIDFRDSFDDLGVQGSNSAAASASDLAFSGALLCADGKAAPALVPSALAEAGLRTTPSGLPLGRGSGRDLLPTRPTPPPRKRGLAHRAGNSPDIAELVQRCTGDVYEKFVARSTAARGAGDPLTVLERVSLRELEAEHQRQQAEAARLKDEQQQRLRREAEELRAREARKLEAIQLLQRVGRACRRRHWLSTRFQEAEDRRSLQYRSQLFTTGFAEASMRSLEGSVDLFGGGMVTVCGGETEEVLPSRSTIYIHHALAARHPGWYDHDRRRQEVERTRSVVVTLQSFLRAHLSTDRAFHLFLHRQAKTVQRVWRGHRSRAETSSLKTQVAQRVDADVRKEEKGDIPSKDDTSGTL